MRFNKLITAMDIKDDNRKRALLLHYIGVGANDSFYTLPEREDNKDYKKACDAKICGSPLNLLEYIAWPSRIPSSLPWQIVNDWSLKSSNIEKETFNAKNDVVLAYKLETAYLPSSNLPL